MRDATTTPLFGTVIANFGQTLLVEATDGSSRAAVARKSAGSPVCGDLVDWSPQPHGPAVVTRIHPRSSLLSRPDQRGKPRQLCANIDQVVVTAAIQPGTPGDGRTAALKHDLIDSYLVAAEILGIEPLIVVNKIDLAVAEVRSGLESALSPYRQAGYRILFTSTASADGLEGLRSALTGHRSVLVGESGVGKSSLIDRLVPDHDLRIGELSVASGKGRHTTTVTMLFHLPDGGDIIDSPGVREFRLWPLSASELAGGFREFRPYLGRCRYRDCRHLHEPDCALSAAAGRGSISPLRLESYRSLLAAYAG